MNKNFGLLSRKKNKEIAESDKVANDVLSGKIKLSQYLKDNANFGDISNFSEFSGFISWLDKVGIKPIVIGLCRLLKFIIPGKAGLAIIILIMYFLYQYRVNDIMPWDLGAHLGNIWNVITGIVTGG